MDSPLTLAGAIIPVLMPGCGARLPFDPSGRMLWAIVITESTMSKAGLDNRHRNHDGEISHKHGTLSSARCVGFTDRLSQPVILKPKN